MTLEQAQDELNKRRTEWVKLHGIACKARDAAEKSWQQVREAEKEVEKARKELPK